MKKRLVYGSSSSIRKKGKGTSKEKLYKTTEERSRVLLIGYKLTDELEPKKCENETFFGRSKRHRKDYCLPYMGTRRD